jgi:hypothetical protein
MPRTQVVERARVLANTTVEHLVDGPFRDTRRSGIVKDGVRVPNSTQRDRLAGSVAPHRVPRNRSAVVDKNARKWLSYKALPCFSTACVRVTEDHPGESADRTMTTRPGVRQDLAHENS